MVPLAPGDANDPRPVPLEPPPPPPPQRASDFQPQGPSVPRGTTDVQPQMATRFGALAIRVQPDDARVSIDGEIWRGPVGQDRLVVQVFEGMHHIEIRKDGFVPYSTEVEVRRDETATLNVSLPRERQ